ncbi:hypothetical protein PC116_g5597 [Phytophthora cactorum]|uniref:Uncharacterized protein n=1 Tax=Phytophthora cactorum TaxID=29920 RepID=A0A8T1DQP7_9STRA|nr:hypothetical protein PC117_g9422 [Phytophthora cactorum]KAG3017088.1 hypothetical protein PC119_g11148 [Phytophthora cactorum]KAG3184380.1 hypothetical protein PC128_g13766 [Phytophthora cactorum]KAG4059909.1 hypothetical protein PC123_g5191 [Phytophthora cactorum]KAG4246577.1 hypothetical protein PC116_g5597 [Phytophthora cactorum]
MEKEEIELLNQWRSHPNWTNEDASQELKVKEAH